MKIKLKEIGKIITGKTPPKNEKDAYGNTMNFLTPGDLKGQRFSDITARQLSEKGVRGLKNNIVSGPSISVSCIGSNMGKTIFNKEAIITNQQLNSITFIRNDVNPLYLYYLLISKRELLHFIGSNQGSTMPILNKKDFGNLEFEIPSFEEQNYISGKLNLLDRKIELNNQINDNLISQLKIISNSYFSYFEAYNGKIPLDWSYTKLLDIANIDAGYSYTSKELVDSNIAMATIKNFDRTGGFNIRGFKEIKPNKIVKKEKYAKLFDILVAHTDLTQNADIIGNAEPILNTSKYSKIIYSMDLVKVTPKAEKISPFLLALLLQGDRFKKHCLGYVNGTTVLHLSKKALKEFEFPFPTSFSDLDNIAKFAERNYKLISNNMKENQKLQNLKQVLLSKYF